MFLPLLLLSVGVGAGVGAVAVAALLLLQLYCTLWCITLVGTFSCRIAVAALLLLQLYCSPWCITLVETFSCRIVALLSAGFNAFPSCVVFLPFLLTFITRSYRQNIPFRQTLKNNPPTDQLHPRRRYIVIGKIWLLS